MDSYLLGKQQLFLFLPLKIVSDTLITERYTCFAHFTIEMIQSSTFAISLHRIRIAAHS